MASGIPMYKGPRKPRFVTTKDNVCDAVLREDIFTIPGLT